MIADTGSLELAHARIGARWGARANQALWQRIELTRELAALLELGRGGGLAHWLHDLTAQADLARIESTLRQRWRDQVRELAAWMPAAWQAAVWWCGCLPDLPALQQWARGETLPSALAAELAIDAPEHVPRRATPWQRLVRRARSEPVLRAWLGEWQELLPAGSGRACIERRLVPLLLRHMQSFAGSPDGWGQRALLVAALSALRRRHPLEPVEAFAYLALQGLELERIRAEVVGRRAFPNRMLHS